MSQTSVIGILEEQLVLLDLLQACLDHLLELPAEVAFNAKRAQVIHRVNIGRVGRS